MGVLMNRRNSFVLGVVLLVTATVMSSANEPSMPGEEFSSIEPIAGACVTPDWDTVFLQECQKFCNYVFPGQYEYNMCYSCVCLKAAAEHEGERESANAQCESDANKVR